MSVTDETKKQALDAIKQGYPCAICEERSFCYRYDLNLILCVNHQDITEKEVLNLLSDTHV